MDIDVYTRLSRIPTRANGEREETSTARQEADCRALAESRGWTVAEVHTDVDASGWTGRERTGFEALLARLEAGDVDGVVAWKLDRLARNRRDMSRILDLVEKHDRVLAIVRDPIDTSSPIGGVITDVLAAFARLESVNISTRVKSARELAAREGKPHMTGRRPFGLTADWSAEVPAEADAIRDAIADVLDAHREGRRVSLGEIGRRWNAAGLISPSGKPWRSATVGQCLRAPRIAGLRDHPEVGRVPGQFPAMTDPDTYDKLAVVLADPARLTGNGPRYLLTGIAVCGRCDHPLSGRPRADGVRRYICRRDNRQGIAGCGKLGILAVQTEDLIRDAVLHRLASPHLVAALAAAEAGDADADLMRRMREDQTALEELAQDHYVTRTITREEFLAARPPLEHAIDDAKRRLRRRKVTQVLADLPADPAGLRALWDRSDLTWRRDLVRAAVERVVVGPATPGNAYDPRRILPPYGPQWRDAAQT